MSLTLKALFRYSYFRLVASLSVVFLVFQGLVWVLATSTLEETFWEANITELYSLTLELERGALHAHGDDVLWGVGEDIDPLIFEAFKQSRAEQHYWMDSAGNEFAMQALSSEDEESNYQDDELFDFTFEGKNYVGEMSLIAGKLRFVALNVDHQHRHLANLNAGILGVALATFLILVAVSYLMAVTSQRRLAAIQRALSLLSDGDLSARCDLPPNNDDLSSIAIGLDDALERLEVATEQTRLFGKNLVHDLRTPLARLRATLEGSQKHHDNFAVALTEVDRIASIIDAMMRIARLQSEVSTASVAPLALTSFAQRLYETYEPVLPERKTLLLEINGDWVIRADEVLLEQAIANLLQNAIIHGGNCITLFTSNGVVGISDDGPGVPEDQFNEIIKPSVRLDPSRGADGAGLGLAFVKAVADHHGARLVVEALMPRGIKFSLQFD